MEFNQAAGARGTDFAIVLLWSAVHIPDGFLAAPVWLGLDVIAPPAVVLLARRAQREFDPARAPLLGVMGAFVFAAQMVNFPVGIGTSGHLVGGALLAITLGPAAACVVMTAILAIQAFVFQDGGILALGANTLNMAVIGVLAGYLPYHFWGAGKWRRVAVFSAASISVMAAAMMALAELLASGIAMPRSIVGVSLVLFLISAVLEGAITVAVVEGIERLSPRLIRKAAPDAFLGACRPGRRGSGAGELWTAGGVEQSGRHPEAGEPDRNRGACHQSHRGAFGGLPRGLAGRVLGGQSRGRTCRTGARRRHMPGVWRGGGTEARPLSCTTSSSIAGAGRIAPCTGGMRG